jgi:serine/threonine protein kinase
VSTPQPLINTGAILAGRWQIQDFIGSGETGEVYGVRDMHSSGIFALKLLWPSALAQPELWSALQQTARTASGLGVEGVARTHDFGIDANSGRPFFVAERVAWTSLADRVRLRGPLTPADMASAFPVLARALDAAHGIGLVHRNLKPENIFVSTENAQWVRISDFGVAWLRSSSPPAPGWGGTVGWVGPDGADPNAQSTPAMDIFALGLVTFFALSGGPLHRAARMAPIDPGALWQELTAPLDSASVRARELGASLDPAFDAWFARAVSPSPQARFASVGEMASAFESIARGLFAPQSQNAVALEGVAAAIAQPLIFQPESLPPTAATPPSTLPASHSAQNTPEAESSSPQAKRRNTAPLFIGGAVICFALTALGTLALYHHHRAAGSPVLAEPSAKATATIATTASPTTLSSAVAPDPPSAAATPTSSSAVATTPTSSLSGAATPTRASAPAPAAPRTASSTAKAAVTPVVTPGPVAPKPLAKTAAATGSATPATASPKPATVSVKAKPGTISAPKKKCGSVFLPCK